MSESEPKTVPEQKDVGEGAPVGSRLDKHLAKAAAAAQKGLKPGAHEAYEEHRRIAQMKHDPTLIRKLFETGEYPYAQRMRIGPYEEHMTALQQELLKAQRWIEENGERII